jgi:hypothetical protein
MKSSFHEAVLRVMLRNTAMTLQMAGAEPQARKLAVTPVNLQARLACVFKALRQVEQSVQVSWGIAKLGPSLYGRASEALALVRLATMTALADPKAEAWLYSLEARSRKILVEVGGEPRGTIVSELQMMEDLLDDEGGEDAGTRGSPSIGGQEGST